jgi:hypothetical protein
MQSNNRNETNALQAPVSHETHCSADSVPQSVPLLRSSISTTQPQRSTAPSENQFVTSSETRSPLRGESIFPRRQRNGSKEPGHLCVDDSGFEGEDVEVGLLWHRAALMAALSARETSIRQNAKTLQDLHWLRSPLGLRSLEMRYNHFDVDLPLRRRQQAEAGAASQCFSILTRSASAGQETGRVPRKGSQVE